MRITPENITELKSNEVFVFGSNLAGKHYGGAAKFAHEKLGYPMGASSDLVNGAIGIPTLGEHLEKLSLNLISFYVLIFHCKIKDVSLSKTKFYITPIGCGIAGFTPDEIAPMFERFINFKNIYLPKSFLMVIYKSHNWWKISSKIKLLILKVM